LFQRVVAVWDSGGQAQKAHQKAKAAGRAVARTGIRDAGLAVALRTLRDRIVKRLPSMEGMFLLVLAVAMVGFALDWALRILGLR
jgi:hypothetical protein